VGTLPTLFTGATFSLGLILVVIAGSELLTGNMALVPIAIFRRKVGAIAMTRNFALVTVGNLVGSIFVAYFLAIKTGVIGSHGAMSGSAQLTYERLAGIAKAKAITESDYQIFLRAVGCNWLVCLAVWLALAADDIAGKVLGIFFRSPRSWPWALITWWPTCSSCPPPTTRGCPASPGPTS